MARNSRKNSIEGAYIVVTDVGTFGAFPSKASATTWVSRKLTQGSYVIHYVLPPHSAEATYGRI